MDLNYFFGDYVLAVVGWTGVGDFDFWGCGFCYILSCCCFGSSKVGTSQKLELSKNDLFILSLLYYTLDWLLGF